MSGSIDDPYTEPPNSTVEDWLGQSVERDRELAERLVSEEGGNLGAAERRFGAEATGADEQHRRLHPVAEGTGVADDGSPGGSLLRDDDDVVEPNEPG